MNEQDEIVRLRNEMKTLAVRCTQRAAQCRRQFGLLAGLGVFLGLFAAVTAGMAASSLDHGFGWAFPLVLSLAFNWAAIVCWRDGQKLSRGYMAQREEILNDLQKWPWNAL